MERAKPASRRFITGATAPATPLAWKVKGNGGNMIVFEKGSTRQLLGNLTWSRVTCRGIDALAIALQRIEEEGERYIRIDCGRIRRADIKGLRLLYVWMQCARFRGVELELVNLSRSLRQLMIKLGLAHCFAGNIQWCPGLVLAAPPLP